jgi:Ni,Fe-hydrogenase III small subunit/formate hydrogenlyase subunit 6/NADH:ubiquinone oxidoreductase subunit I
VFRILSRSLRAGIVTRRDPFAERPVCGFPVVDCDTCTACGDCARSCPTGALRIDAPAPGRRTLSLSYAACIQCRECVSACGENGIRLAGDHELAAYSREQLVRRAAFVHDAGLGRGACTGVDPQPETSLAESAERLRARIAGRLGRSLHVRQVDAGSCNGCEAEIAATANPVFDLERFGIHFVASPRHADLLLVTGPVTRNMEVALRRTYDATPEPRLVVAVGTCGCSGGLFGEGGYASVGAVDRVLPVDVYVPGCPPRPHAILNALLVAMGVREARCRPESTAPAAAIQVEPVAAAVAVSRPQPA